MRSLDVYVGEMACRRCVREVTARLRDVPGVLTVVADAPRSLVRITGSMSDADVLAAMAGTAFTAQLADELGPD
jgi:copper chaperone CopZ